MSNKSVKEQLIKLYGEECFIEKLGLRKFKKPVHYKSKKQMKRMKALSYHHITKKEDGGPTTVENGAILSVENHEWFHQQSKEAQDKMNKIFQEYKKCKLELVDNILMPIEIETSEIYFIEDKLEIKRLKEDRRKDKEFNKIKQEYVDR